MRSISRAQEADFYGGNPIVTTNSNVDRPELLASARWFTPILPFANRAVDSTGIVDMDAHLTSLSDGQDPGVGASTQAHSQARTTPFTANEAPRRGGRLSDEKPASGFGAAKRSPAPFNMEQFVEKDRRHRGRIEGMHAEWESRRMDLERVEVADEGCSGTR